MADEAIVGTTARDCSREGAAAPLVPIVRQDSLAASVMTHYEGVCHQGMTFTPIRAVLARFHAGRVSHGLCGAESMRSYLWVEMYSIGSYCHTRLDLVRGRGSLLVLVLRLKPAFRQ